MNTETPTAFPYYEKPNPPGPTFMHPKESAPLFKIAKFMLKGRKASMTRSRAPKGRKTKFY